jgi:hypothetical protein
MAFSIVPYALGTLSFNGTNQYLSVPSTGTNTVFTFTGDFTVEGWYYPTNVTGGHSLFCLGTETTNRYVWALSGTSVTSALFGGATTTYTSTVPINTWTHIAVVRSGTTVRVYINGTASATTDTQAGTIGNGKLNVAADSAGAAFFAGYISTIRVCNVAVYTGTFTVPTQTLTATQSAGTNIAAISLPQTVLLLQMPFGSGIASSQDSSVYAVPVANNNGPSTLALSPFAAVTAAAFNITTNPLGSVSFNGTTQYLTTTVATSSSLDLATGAGNWTVECWFYATSLAGSGSIFWKTASTNPSYALWLNATQPQWIVGDGAGGGGVQNLPVITTNTWYHFALVRNGSTFTAYTNGVGYTPYTTPFTMGNGGASTTLYVGAASDGRYFPGYISNFRITKGVAVYTSNFIPPTGPLPGIQAANVNSTNSAAITGIQTSLLLQTPNNGSFITDSSGYALTMTNNGTATANSISPFSTANSSVWQGVAFGSASLNGTTQYLSTTGTASGTLDLAAGAGNWTVECWFYPNSVTGQQSIFWKGGTSGSVNPSYAFFLNGTGGQWIVGDGGGGAAGIQNVSVTFAIGTWYHFALVRNGSTFTAYINGVGQTPVAISGTMGNTTNNALSIGSSAADGSTRFVSGYISNFRIVKGVAVYTGNFTVPIRPLTSTQTSRTNISAITGTQTSLLLNTPNTSAFITDSSSVPYTMTNNGTIVANGTTPFTLTAGPVVWATFQGLGGYPVGSLLFANISKVSYTSSSFAFGTGTFTAECWVWVSPSASSIAGFLSSCTGFQAGFIIAKDIVGITGAGGSGGALISLGAAITTSTWTHVALVRNAGTMTCYVNGTAVGTPQASSTSCVSQTIALATRYSDDSGSFIGYITNSRVVSGVAVYTGNFTPSTTPLQVTQSSGTNISAITVDTQTKLLNWTSNNATYLSDASTNNLTGTVTGTVTSNSLAPFA